METIKILLQAGTLIAVVVGLGLTLRQVKMLRVNYVDLHDWNRRKAAQDAVDDIVARLADGTLILNEKFDILTTRNTIPYEVIEKECKADKTVRLAIHKRLNYFESLASGVQQGVFDEEVIKNSHQHVIRNALIHFKEYIEHMRTDQGARDLLIDIEGMTERWNQQDREKPARSQTGHDPTAIRARQSSGG